MNSISPPPPMRLRVIADRGACCGYGLCAEVCPEVYKLDANGIVIDDIPLVAPGLEDKAREGAQACPQGALAVEEVPDPSPR